jgi:hypothetical protein
MNPLLLPVRNFGIYGVVGLLSICSFILLSVLKRPHHDLSGYLFYVMLFTIFLPIIVLFVQNRVALLHSTPLSTETIRRIDHLFAEGVIRNVEFRVGRVKDARAVRYGRRQCCLLSQEDIKSLEALEVGNLGSGRESFVVAKISHELAHILSNDADAFSLFTLAWCWGLGLFTVVWLEFVARTGEGFRVTGLAGLALILSLFGACGYQAVRLREFYADRLAAYLSPEAKIEAFLEKNALRERFLTFPFGYRLTHPTFLDRLAVFRNFSAIYQFRTLDIFAFSFLYALLYFVVPMTYSAASREIGTVTGFSVAVAGYMASLLFIFISIAPGALTRSIDFKQIVRLLIFNAILSPFFQFIFISSIAGVEVGATPFQSTEMAIAFFVLLPTYTILLWYLCGDLGKFRGPKKLTKGFLAVLFVLNFVMFGLAMIVVNTVF